VARLQAAQIKIIWLGREHCYDDILVESMWRTLKPVAAGFSAKSIRRRVSACLERWLGCRNRPGPPPMEVLPWKASQLLGRQNSKCSLHWDRILFLTPSLYDFRERDCARKASHFRVGKRPRRDQDIRCGAAGDHCCRELCWARHGSL